MPTIENATGTSYEIVPPAPPNEKHDIPKRLAEIKSRCQLLKSELTELKDAKTAGAGVPVSTQDCDNVLTPLDAVIGKL